MRVTILLLILAVLFAVGVSALEDRETAEPAGRGETRAMEQTERIQSLQTNGAPQFTTGWALVSLGGL